MHDLSNTTVLVTGASSGIGAATATAFASAGARLLLCARRVERLTELAVTLDVETDVFALDVRDRDAVFTALGERNDIDVLVNNAGLASGFEPVHTADPVHWDRMIDTNVMGLLNVTRAVVPAMVERGRGHVVNIGSIAGRETYPNGAVYCASKAAVDRITTGLRMDLLGTGVRVSTVDPGLVETEFSIVRFEGDTERADSVYQGLTPLTPADVADAILWVASRPPHVQVADVVLMPTDQASATRLARRDQ
jgi:3-hydroxy acid dehydrogenase/malonic semialdehyde reductase